MRKNNSLPQNCFDINARATYHGALMSEGLPERVDVERLAARGAQLDSVTPVAAMTRLAGLLADATGGVESELRFSHESGRSRIDGSARAQVRVACQRCFEPMPVTLDVELHLALVKDDAQADALPDGVDPALSIDGHVSPRDLVEDELILALPFAPLHEVDACSVRPAETPATDKQNPFAVLRQLKKR